MSGIQYKRVQERDSMREDFRARGMVFTINGPMKREEAIKRGIDYDEIR